MVLVISNKTKNEYKTIIKSLGDSKLEYFKNKILAILDKKEKEENLNKSWDEIEIMQKSRAMPIGTIQTWKGKKFKKMPNKKWVRVYDHQNRSAEISIARLKGRVRRATSVDELFEIVTNNIHRFEDENGKTLDIVKELKAEVDKTKNVINKDKPKFDYEKARKEIAEKKENENNKQSAKVYNNIDFNKLPKYLFGYTTKLNKAINIFCDGINSVKIEDKNIAFLIKNLGNAMSAVGENNFIIEPKKVRSKCGHIIYIPEFNDINTRRDDIITTLHEFTHKMDASLSGIVNSNIGKVYEIFDETIKEVPKAFYDYRGETAIKNDNYINEYNEYKEKLTEEANSKYPKAIESPYYYDLKAKYMKRKMNEFKRTHKRYIKLDEYYDGLSDIVDALSGGKLFSSRRLLAGHGAGYYSNKISRAKECIANYIPMKVFMPKQVEVVKEMSPKLYNYLEYVLETMVDNLKTKMDNKGIKYD